jgi:hypothetical protein
MMMRSGGAMRAPLMELRRATFFAWTCLPSVFPFGDLLFVGFVERLFERLFESTARQDHVHVSVSMRDVSSI